MNKGLKIILIVLGSIVGLVLIIFLCLSLFGGSVAKNYVNQHGEDILGRHCEVEHVGLNLFTGNVAVHGLSVYEDDGKEKFAGFDTLDVGVSLLRLIGKTVHVRHITLAGLDVSVWQEGDRFNFSSIIDHFAQEEEEEVEKDTTPSSWVISLHDIHLRHGRIDYTDRPRQSHWGFNNLNLMVPDFTTGGEGNTDAGVALAFEDGGSLKANANYSSTTNDFEITLGLSGFELEQVRPYLTETARIEAMEGHLNIDANVTGNLSKIMDMAIAAQVGIDDVKVDGDGGKTIASLGHLGVDVNKIVLGQNLFDISSVELNGLEACYEQFADGSNTMSRLLVSKENIDSTEVEQVNDSNNVDTTQSKPLSLHIGKLELMGINLTYADHSMADDFTFGVKDLRLNANDLTTKGRNNARMMAKLPNGGMAIVDWNGDLDNWKSYQRLRLDIKNLHLTDLSPYMVTYFGMPFDEGIFSFTSLNTITNSQIEGKNHIDIYKPTLGEKRKDVKPRLNLPVRAAMYILKDKDEKISLPVPITGNVDSPKFNYMNLVWKTLGNLIVKVVTSPTRLLGQSGDEDELFIAIDQNEHDFTSEQYYQIDKVAEVAKSDEMIVLNLELRSRPTNDSTIARSHHRRSVILQRHLSELGLDTSQYRVTTAEPDANVKSEGYVVTTGYKESY